MKTRILTTILFILLVPSIAAAAKKHSENPKKSRSDAYPLLGTRDVYLDNARLDSVLTCLDKGQFDRVPLLFFGDPRDDSDGLFDKNLADLVVYYDRAGNTHVSLVKNRKQETRLHGDRNVWVMIFSEREFVRAPDTTKTATIVSELPKSKSNTVTKTTHQTESTSTETVEEKGGKSTTTKVREVKDPSDATEVTKTVEGNDEAATKTTTQTIKYPDENFQVRHESLEHRLTPAETLLEAVGSALSGLGVTSPASPKSLPDSMYSVPVDTIGQADGRTLYFGMQKLNLEENTINRISVGPKDPVRATDARATKKSQKNVYATFGNYSDSRFGISLALGAVFDLSPDSTTHKTEFDPYVFGHLYLTRPKQPRSDRTQPFGDYSTSIVVGARIGGETHFFDDPVVGLSLGHILGPLGIVGGVVWRSESHVNKDKTVDLRRKERALIAINLML